MMKSLTLVFALAATACGGGSKKAEPTTAPITTTAPTAAAGTLTIAEMKLWDVNKNRALIIHADGLIEVDGRKPAKVTADGKIVKADTGEVGFTLEADGSVKGPNGVDTGAKISADGTLAIKDQTITIDDKGMVIGGNEKAPPLKIEGATDANLKRTALFVLVAMMTATEPQSTVTSGSSAN
jgi:hypothetical protein